jgi:VIT1/CCC1 family predicted Fe2+/Mn2+ transporter
MGCLADKGRALQTFRAVRAVTDPAKAQKLIAEALPGPVAAVLQPQEFAMLDQRLKQLPEPPDRARLSKKDWVGALGVFLLVFLCTFPVALPFIFIQKALTALRVSNAVAVAMLFMAGLAYGRCVGRRSWIMGVLMVLLGLALVGLTIILGG